jgi:hypothetical protein
MPDGGVDAPAGEFVLARNETIRQRTVVVTAPVCGVVVLPALATDPEACRVVLTPESSPMHQSEKLAELDHETVTVSGPALPEGP